MTICYVTQTYSDAAVLQDMLPPDCKTIMAYPWDARLDGSFRCQVFDIVIVTFQPITDVQQTVVDSEWSTLAPQGAMRFSSMQDEIAILKKKFHSDAPSPIVEPVLDIPNVDTETKESRAAVKLVKSNAALEEEVLRQFDKIQQTGIADPIWLALARTQVEQAFMCANRSIMKPKRIEGPV